MGNAQGNSIDAGQCCFESRNPSQPENKVVMTKSPSVEDKADLYGVGLVFRTTRDGKMVVSSFVKDSSAYECGLVRDGGCPS
jgi:hypothetical protein